MVEFNLQRAINIEEDSPGEWMSTQSRLLVAGLRTCDLPTIKAAIDNITSRFGDKNAESYLLSGLIDHVHTGGHIDDIQNI